MHARSDLCDAPGRGALGTAPRAIAAPFRSRLVVMAKAPVAGRAKTRLAREVGLSRALTFARAGGLASIRRLSRDPRWECTLAVTPDAAVHVPVWPRGVRIVAQGHGNLGVRMQRIFDAMPPGPVLIVGTDIPRIAPRHVAHAFRLLAAHDAVLGPAGDGGYWLVGLNRRPGRRAPFANVRWSSPHALADTLANLEGCRVARADGLEDVDDAESLRRNADAAGRVVIGN